jgi:hypothetical protein
MERRDLLKLLGGAGVLTLAGCATSTKRASAENGYVLSLAVPVAV